MKAAVAAPGEVGERTLWVAPAPRTASLTLAMSAVPAVVGVAALETVPDLAGGSFLAC